jgi:hypothetical protein
VELLLLVTAKTGKKLTLREIFKWQENK